MGKENSAETFKYRLILNLSIIYYVFRKQFFGRNKFIFLVFPLIISCIIVAYELYIDIFNPAKISLIVTIISLIAGMLLNFLVLILTDKGSILYTEGIKEAYAILEGRFDNQGDPIRINYFEFIYNKIFFIILLSISFILVYIINDIGVFQKISINMHAQFVNNQFCKDYPIYFKYIKDFGYGIYIYFIMFYFINLLYLVQKLIILLTSKYNGQKK
ncbi:MAG: hypothetical protein HHAS10_06280 [Candidatus Altimarinota bacterium]